jgi:hypothetical protein
MVTNPALTTAPIPGRHLQRYAAAKLTFAGLLSCSIEKRQTTGTLKISPGRAILSIQADSRTTFLTHCSALGTAEVLGDGPYFCECPSLIPIAMLWRMGSSRGMPMNAPAASSGWRFLGDSRLTGMNESSRSV